MKKNPTKVTIFVVIGLCLIVTIGVLARPGASNQDSRNFWALNNTGRTIRQLYVSPHESETWGKDILGTAELPNGLGTTITFDSNVRSSCVMGFQTGIPRRQFSNLPQRKERLPPWGRGI